MPTFNHSQFIGEAIESVLNQTFKDFELIIVDNYSEDETKDIVESFNDKRIKYYLFHNNGIIAASRNYGIKKAKGKYLAFIDSDDVWFKDKLERQINCFRKYPSINFIFTSFKVISSDKTDSGKLLGPNKDVQGLLYKKLLNYNFIVTSSVVMHKSIVDNVGFFDESQELQCVEDFDYWLRIAKKHEILGLSKPLGMYRIHNTNSGNNDQRLMKAFYVLDSQIQLASATKLEIDNAKANIYFREGWLLIDNDVVCARKYFKQSLKISNNFKIYTMCFIGIVFSFMPKIYSYFRVNNIDRKIGSIIFKIRNI